MKTALVVNPQARAFRLREKLISAVRLRAGGAARIWVTADEGALAQAAQALLEWEPDRVVLCGGDGTLMASVTALWRASEGRALPELVVAPAGTVATVARNWGQRAELLTTVARATTGAAPLKRLTSPSLRVLDCSEAVERIGFILGTGLVARFFEKYYARGGGGYASAARIVARTFVGSFLADSYSRSILDPLPCRLRVDGKALCPDAFSLVVTSVVRDLGLHMRVTHRAGEDPERPHLVASPLAARQLGPQAPRVLLGRALSGAENFDGLYGDLEIEFPDGRGPWVLDGDVLFSERLQIRAGPQLRIAVY